MQRLTHRGAEIEILHELLEFPAQRFRCFLGEHMQAAVDVVPGAHRPCKQIDGVGQHFLNLPHTPLAPGPNVDQRQQGAAEGEQKFQDEEGKQPKHIGGQIAARQQQHAECHYVARTIG